MARIWLRPLSVVFILLMIDKVVNLKPLDHLMLDLNGPLEENYPEELVRYPRDWRNVPTFMNRGFNDDIEQISKVVYPPMPGAFIDVSLDVVPDVNIVDLDDDVYKKYENLDEVMPVDDTSTQEDIRLNKLDEPLHIEEYSGEIGGFTNNISPNFETSDAGTVLLDENLIINNEYGNRLSRDAWRASIMSQNIPGDPFKGAKYLFSNLSSRGKRRRSHFDPYSKNYDLSQKWKRSIISDEKMSNKINSLPNAIMTAFRKHNSKISDPDLSPNSDTSLEDPHIAAYIRKFSPYFRVVREVNLEIKAKSCWRYVGGEVYYCKPCPYHCYKNMPAYFLADRVAASNQRARRGGTRSDPAVSTFLN